MQERFPLSDGMWQDICCSLRLSPRQRQIIQGILEDKKEEVIARDLGIARGTVHTQIGRLYRKLEAGCRAGVVVRVFAEYVSFCENGNGNGG